MDYILIGNSGHAKVIRDSIEASGDRVFAILDDRDVIPSMDGEIFRGPISELTRLLEIEERRVILAYSDNGVRKQLVEFLKLPEERYGIVIHPKAIVSPFSEIGAGTVIMPGAIVNSGAVVGKHSILNSMSVVEHESVLQAYVHVSTGAVITREVTVAQGASLGANSTVIPNRKIGEWSIVGAGSAVIADLPAGCTAVGCPARILDKE
jgi:acetyltransferase EpsM